MSSRSYHTEPYTHKQSVERGPYNHYNIIIIMIIRAGLLSFERGTYITSNGRLLVNVRADPLPATGIRPILTVHLLIVCDSRSQAFDDHGAPRNCELFSEASRGQISDLLRRTYR